VTCVGDKKEVDVSEVFPLDGTPYERLISKDGHPLTADEQKHEDDKYKKELKKRESETPGERAARIAKYEKERAFISEIPNAYDFKLVGEDAVNGRPAWIVSLTPKEGFVPEQPHASLLKHIEGKLWIDKKDLQWARAEANVKDTVAIGFILARIGPGAHIEMEFSRLSDSLWMPKSLSIKGDAKVLLVHTKDLDEDLTFTNYRQASGAGEQVARNGRTGGR
jgi:hypothetical protein